MILTETLSAAVTQTFNNRKTELTQTPVVFTDEFSLRQEKKIQWLAFQKRTGISNIPQDFSVIVEFIKEFLQPIYKALTKNEIFIGRWDKEKEMWIKNGF
jgi:hypothetical protein